MSKSYVVNDVNYHLETLIIRRQRFSANDLRALLSKGNLHALKTRTGTIGRAIQGAARAKRIRQVGWTRATHGDAHNHVIAEWQAV